MLALAAIAAVTGEVRLGSITDKPADARQTEMLQRLSRGRFITLSLSPPLVGRTREGVVNGERWRRVNAPADRESWTATLQEIGEAADGILVPMSPPLLDILRHPHETIDRPDLMLAQG